MSAKTKGGGDGYQLWLVALTLILPPFLVVPTLHLPFRLPKLLASELLGIASLLVLAFGLWSIERVPLSTLGRLPALRAGAPLLLVALASLATTSHAAHVRDAVWSLGVATLCLVGWSLIDPARLRRTLDVVLLPATGLSLLVILQYHDLFRPFEFLAGEEARRRGLTSAAGSVGDLAAYLVLPCLLAQAGMLVWIYERRARSDARRRRKGRLRWLPYLVALLIVLYAVAIIQTLAAVAGLAASSLLLWTLILPRRRRWLVAAGGLALLTSALLVAPPLRQRIAATVRSLEHGGLNAALSGRLDGWSTALWMLEQRPATGVGHGAYVAEFTAAKLALVERGVEFYPGQTGTTFGNVHNEGLELAAELGLPGLVAMLWLLLVLVGSCWRRWRAARGAAERAEAGLPWAVLLAYALLAMAYFPFRLALTAYPALAVASLILAGPRLEVRG